jgi:hypothetical protein
MKNAVITDRYLAHKIYGVPAGPEMLMVSTSEASPQPAAYASEFEHDLKQPRRIITRPTYGG